MTAMGRKRTAEAPTKWSHAAARIIIEAILRIERFTPANPRRVFMPAKSAAQQKAAGAALSAKRGETPKSKLKGASKSMASSMTEKELKKMAWTSRKGKVEHKSQ
jgi:hypothetical protein